MGVLCETLW